MFASYDEQFHALYAPMSSFFPCKDPEAKVTKSVNPNDFYLLTSNDYNLKNYITAVFIFPVSKIDKKLLKHSVL